MVVAQAAKYVFNVGAAGSAEEIYKVVSVALGRPCPAGPYGLVWELDNHPMPVEVTVVGLPLLRERLPTQARFLEMALRQVAERHSSNGFVLHVA